MDDARVIDLHEDIPADWSFVAGVLEAILAYGYSLNVPGLPTKFRQPSWNKSIPGIDPHFELLNEGRLVADIQLTHGKKNTHLHIKTAYGNILLCRRIIATLHLAVKATQDERQAERPTAESTIELYYRKKAAGGKVTLRTLASESGYSYDYLRKVKREYDAAGKWGSKKGTQ